MKYTKKVDIKIIKPKIYIFDLDGCIADSDNFVLTNEQAFKIDPEIQNRYGAGFRGLLTKENKKDFSDAYMIDHQMEIKPYEGIFDLFVRMSQVGHTAIVTARPQYMSTCTIQWLEKNVIQYYGESVWRRLSYKLYFNDTKDKSLAYKKKMFEQLKETYDIVLVIDDHPDIAKYLKSINVMCLVPSTGYKDLNGKDRN